MRWPDDRKMLFRAVLGPAQAAQFGRDRWQRDGQVWNIGRPCVALHHETVGTLFSRLGGGRLWVWGLLCIDGP